jgi:hypothetical protein
MRTVMRKMQNIKKCVTPAKEAVVYVTSCHSRESGNPVFMRLQEYLKSLPSRFRGNDKVGFLQFVKVIKIYPVQTDHLACANREKHPTIIGERISLNGPKLLKGKRPEVTGWTIKEGG